MCDRTCVDEQGWKHETVTDTSVTLAAKVEYLELTCDHCGTARWEEVS